MAALAPAPRRHRVIHVPAAETAVTSGPHASLATVTGLHGTRTTAGRTR